MIFSLKQENSHSRGKKFFSSFLQIRRSIYGRVVIIIFILSFFMFVSFGAIFMSVHKQYMDTVILQRGKNVGSLVEGALYYSMLENDKGALQNEMDVIHSLPGIEGVNLYNKENNLVYSTYTSDTTETINMDCKSCHADIGHMFPEKEKAYKIFTAKSGCMMNKSMKGQRHLLIKSPILNSKSCYTSSCHAHTESEVVLGSLVINLPLQEIDKAVKSLSARFYLMAVFTTIMLAFFLILFTRRQIKTPLNELIKASEAVSKGDKNIRVKINPDLAKDIRMVSVAFNDMLDNLRAANTELENWSQQLEYKVRKKSEELGAAQNELIHIDRLASLGKLSSSVAHEINNPLSGILVYTKLIHKQLSNPELSDTKKGLILKQLKLIESETRRCGEIVKGLLEFSKKDQEGFETRPLHEILEETYDLMTHSIKIANISFLKDFSAKNDLISCSSNQIKQACVALLVNALEAVTDSGEIMIRTSNPDEDDIRLEISDSGIGISADVLPHIFEPFFSTKLETHGIGLGLAIVHGIIQSHKGKIAVKSEPGKGTTVSIILPLVRI